MPAFLAPLAIAGISALGGLLSNRAQKQTQTQRQNFNRTGTSTTTPTFDPQSDFLRRSLIDQFINRLGGGGDLADVVTQQAVSGANRGALARRRQASSSLSARGLGFSPAAGALGDTIESERVSNVIGAQNQRNLIAEELVRQRLGDAGGFFSQLPFGQTATTSESGSSEGFGETQIPGNRLGGAFSSLGTTLAGLYGAGAFGGR